MILYGIIILITTGLTIGLNILFHPGNEPFYYYIYWTFIFLAGALIVDALTALIIRRCFPEKFVLKKRRIYTTSMNEMKFYRSIKINKWKDKVPELGGFTDFHKNKFDNPNSSEYVLRFIIEARYGALIHIWSCPLSFLILLLDYRIYLGTTNFIFLTIGLPVAIVNAILILLPAFILKNNLYRLDNIYESNLRREKMEQEQNA